MEISFNTSRIPNPAANQPVARPNTSSTKVEGETPTDAAALKDSLKDIPLVRTEKVEAARTKVADLKYPPTEMLDRIANLLALNIKQ